MEPIYSMEISMGTLDVYEDRIIITHDIPLERDGFYERIIPMKSIKAIQFKAGSKRQGGYLQFIIPGCNAQNILSGGSETAKDGNAVVFSASEQDIAEEIKDYIVERIV